LLQVNKQRDGAELLVTLESKYLDKLAAARERLLQLLPKQLVVGA
jgi:hypothetical protein